MEAAMGRRASFVLTTEEREVLERWARRPKSAQALALRCRIVLAAADGENAIDITARLGCSRGTVSKWRGRFAERGLDGLHDEPRPMPSCRWLPKSGGRLSAGRTRVEIWVGRGHPAAGNASPAVL
jgi:DNA-binding CsgD family transcriptional regulator